MQSVPNWMWGDSAPYVVHLIGAIGLLLGVLAVANIARGVITWLQFMDRTR